MMYANTTYHNTPQIANSISYPSHLWLTIPSHPRYEIKPDGSAVRNRDTLKALTIFLKRERGNTGLVYYRVGFGHVHRLLKSALEGRILARNEIVCHIDNDSLNNDPGNLRIGSYRSNSKDRIRNNTNGIKLRNQDVREIRKLYATGKFTYVQLAKTYCISKGHTYKIITGKAWRNLE